LKTNSNPLAGPTRTFSEKTAPDKTIAEVQVLFDNNLGEMAGDSKYLVLRFSSTGASVIAHCLFQI
jgi:hypothetical protein